MATRRATPATARTASAKKAGAKKVTAKSAGAKKASVKKAGAKKAGAQKAGAQKVSVKKASVKKASVKKASRAPRLLSGGNPQIPKGDGRAPVQAYLDAMPGWKHDVGVALDAIVVRTVPDAQQRVRWNSPFYGSDDDSWFASFHCFDEFVRVTFAQGESLEPMPAGRSKVPGVRYHDVREHDEVDEAELASWMAQASSRPGERF